MSSRRPRLSVEDHVRGILAGDRAVLARAITLVESNHPRHRAMAQEVLLGVLPHSGGAQRVGITGVPGVGKSTFIEALGHRLVEAGHRLAVLAIDPTSTVTGGSILGDKTRMGRLSTHPAAFVRPSPTRGSLGGVHQRTRETLLLCEAAGFDVVFVETVGVGQSETTVVDMVDSYLVLMLAGAGDELQGIKRGILELAEILVIHKADGDNRDAALRARREYLGALRFMKPTHPGWRTPVLTCSSYTGEGIEAVWEAVGEHRSRLIEDGALSRRRQEQARRWMWTLVEEAVLRDLRENPAVVRAAGDLEKAVVEGTTTATRAAQSLLKTFEAARDR